jgi:hypothetical protein
MFGVEFDGKKDCNSVGEKKMDEVCRIVGQKLIKEWVQYGKRKGKIKNDDVMEYYNWITLLEEDFDYFFDIKKDIDED